MKPSCNFYELNKNGLIEEANFLKSTNFDARPKDKSINMVVIHSISLPPNKFGGTYIEDFFTNKLKIEKNSYFEFNLSHVKIELGMLVNQIGKIILTVMTFQ